MEERYAFFHRGHLLTIPREASERKVRYSLRIGFIVQRVGKYDLHMLEEYSRMYADMVLFGMKYPPRVQNILGNMLGMSQPVEELVDQADIMELAQDVMPGQTVVSATNQAIVFEEGASVKIAEPEDAYLQIEPNVPLEGAILTEVVFEPSVEDGERANIVLNLDAEGETVRVQTCGDDVCSVPADVVVSVDKLSEHDVLKTMPVEDIPARQEFGIDVMQTATTASLPASPRAEIVEPVAEAPQEVVAEPAIEVPQEVAPSVEIVEPPEKATSPPISPPPERPQSPRLIIIEEDSNAPVDTVVCKFLERDLPKPSRELIKLRFESDLMRGALIEFKESILYGLFEAYDVGVFGGELGKATREGKLKVEMKWTEDPTAPLAGADISGILCTLTLSKPMLVKMASKCKEKHEIFGMSCETQIDVIMTLVESFCTLVAAELCEMGERYAEFAKKLFGHEGSEQKISPPADDIRQRIQDLKKDANTVVKVTLKDGKEYTVAGARGLTEVLLNDGEEKKRVPYGEVTHLNGEPL